MTRHNPFNGMFVNLPWPIIDTRPDPFGVIMYSPGHPRNDVYREDMEKFSNLGDDRRAFIRRRSGACEVSPGGWNIELAKIMPVWCVIVRVAPGSYLELPFWRGHAPCAVEPKTDSEVAAVVAECVAKGGYDHVALCEWRKALAALK